jgi:hypothetical protein
VVCVSDFYRTKFFLKKCRIGRILPGSLRSDSLISGVNRKKGFDRDKSNDLASADGKLRAPGRSVLSTAMFAQGAEDDNAADRKRHHGGERGDQHQRRVQVKNVSEYGRHGEYDPHQIAPK